MSCQRSPNLPAAMVSALEFGLMRLICAASKAVVPEPAMESTGDSVLKSHLSLTLSSLTMSMNCAVLWWMMGLPISSRTCCGTAVGPGVSRRCFVKSGVVILVSDFFSKKEGLCIPIYSIQEGNLSD